MASSISQIIRNANKRIQHIKDAGMEPITLKSPANVIEKFIEPKGTSREGLFKTWSQVREEFDDITKLEWEEIMLNFLGGKYGKQTSFSDALDYNVERAELIVEMFADEDYLKKFYKLSKREKVNLIRDAGEAADFAEKNGHPYGSGYFYHYIYDYLDTKSTN